MITTSKNIHGDTLDRFNGSALIKKTKNGPFHRLELVLRTRSDGKGSTITLHDKNGENIGTLSLTQDDLLHLIDVRKETGHWEE